MARKKKVAAGEVKAMRRNKETGELAPPTRGRPSPEWERGYVDEAGEFHAGALPGKRGRKAGRKAGRPKGSGKGGALSARLRAIIEREVGQRLKGLHKEIASEVRSQVLADLAG